MTGTAESYTVTYLEMTRRPSAPPPLPSGARVALLKATDPPVDYFLYLYRQVGDGYLWTDWLNQPREAQEAFVADRQVGLFTMVLDGWPGGFFMLDTRQSGVCDLAYFGLVPQAIGRGLGHWLLATAVSTGWSLPGVARMTVNTCTLDHPRALPLYQKIGFRPIRREERPMDENGS
ncbi:MAG: GNAT family N-acetyltransferase [Paracoccaceae bacterium]